MIIRMCLIAVGCLLIGLVVGFFIALGTVPNVWCKP